MRFLLVFCLLLPGLARADAPLRVIGTNGFTPIVTSPALHFTAHDNAEILVRDGLAIDLLLSSRSDWLDRLSENHQILPESRVVLGHSPLVIVGRNVPEQGQRMIGLGRWWQQQLGPQGRLAIGYPAILNNDFFQSLSLNKTQITPASPGAALAMVRDGRAALGIVNQQDFEASGKSDIVMIAALPTELVPAIVIEAAIPTAAKNPEAAAVFLEKYLLSINHAAPLPGHF